jgi:60S ribosomal subunit assembly/export protein LOC1
MEDFQLHHILTMAPSRTTTVKSKHATNKSGIRNSKTSGKPQGDGISKSKKPKGKGPPPKPQKNAGGLAALKKKRRVYTEKELSIPALNMITPVGVETPKGKKKGKIFVDDRVCGPSPFCRRQAHQNITGEHDDDPCDGKCG